MFCSRFTFYVIQIVEFQENLLVIVEQCHFECFALLEHFQFDVRDLFVVVGLLSVNLSLIVQFFFINRTKLEKNKHLNKV